MGKQKAAVIAKYNDEDPSASIKVVDRDIPSELKEGDVLVRMILRPINPSDMFCMRGRYGGFTPSTLPAVPGLEGPPCACKQTTCTLERLCLQCTFRSFRELNNRCQPTTNRVASSSRFSNRQTTTHAGLGVVQKLGPKTGERVSEGQRVVSVPWPTAEGEGTYQQYVAVPEKHLVGLLVKSYKA